MKAKSVRQEIVAELAKKRANRNNAQQLKELDNRLGVGVGAKKERARLMKDGVK